MQVPEWHPVTRWCRVARVDPPSPENRYKYSTVVSRRGMVPGRLFGVAFLASLAVAEFGEYGEEGVTDVHGNFIPGASGIYSQKCSRELYLVNMRALTEFVRFIVSGRDWPHPEAEDWARIHALLKHEDAVFPGGDKAKEFAETPWPKVSWKQVNCCQNHETN